MEINTFLAIENRLNCNATIDEQRKYVPLIIEILKINQQVIKEGLLALEKHIQDDKLPYLFGWSAFYSKDVFTGYNEGDAVFLFESGFIG